MNTVPLYHKIKEAILEEIEQNMQPGDLLSPEPELQRRYGVSRITIRRAMQELENAGVIVKRQGKGTFVQEKMTHELSYLTSWTESMTAQGLIPKTLKTEITEIDPPPRIIEQLKMELGEKIVRISRVRGIGEEAISIMTNYLREKYVPGLAVRSLNKESVYQTLENDYGLELAFGKDIVGAREATDQEAAILGIQPYSPVLIVTRTTFLTGNIPLEISVVVSRADRYQYQVMLSGRR